MLPSYLKYKKNELYYENINIMDLVHKYGDCLEVRYPHIIGDKIKYFERLFKKSIKDNNYSAQYFYTYATKANYNSEVIMEVIKHTKYLETSSKNDLGLLKYLFEKKIINKKFTIVCNGFKDEDYFKKIIYFIKQGVRIIPIIENFDELEYVLNLNMNMEIGIRINVDKIKNQVFGLNECSRFGFYYDDIIKKIDLIKNSNLKLSLFHFHMNGSISDLNKYLKLIKRVFNEYYVPLKREFESLNIFDFGGCFPVLSHEDFDYEKLVNGMVKTLKNDSLDNKVSMPNLIGEHGAVTVSDYRFDVVKVRFKKEINKDKYWYIINNSIVNLVPDTWITYKDFLVLPINLINNRKIKAKLAGLTCDSLDVYFYQEHKHYLDLPCINEGEELYIGIFKIGAYQELMSGRCSPHHCLIEEPKKIIIDDEIKVIKNKQTNEEIISMLNYE